MSLSNSLFLLLLTHVPFSASAHPCAPSTSTSTSQTAVGLTLAQPSPQNRRNFVLSTLVNIPLVMQKQQPTNSKDFDYNNKSIHSLQHFPYSGNWIGTGLPIMSIHEAASRNGMDFEMGRWPDPILRKSANIVSEPLFGGEALKIVANKLRQTARVNKAVGLAAQQCGIDGSLIFLDEIKYIEKYRSSRNDIFNDRVDNKGGIFLCNPRIISRSPEIEMKIWTEECLVLPPSFTATVLRDNSIKVEYETLDGETRTTKLSGELARALQHEMDHDRGILIVDHVSLEDLDSLLMMEIERDGHDDRMALAYSRYLQVSLDKLVSCGHYTFIEPAYAVEPFENIILSKKSSEMEKKDQTICDDECISQRRKKNEDRRALMKQSKSNTKRSDVLEPSAQRAALYNTEYEGMSPAWGAGTNK